MFNDTHVILHLRGPRGEESLDRAYRLSVARYTRLTRRGPLSYYRNVLLADAQKAFLSLRGSTPTWPTSTGSANRKDHQSRNGFSDSPLSQVKILPSEPVQLKGRTLRHCQERPMGATWQSRPVEMAAPGSRLAPGKTAQVQLEDAFCREVLYRLEGDLIRYTSRQELLQIATAAGLHLFQANLLMAQIVESVRRHKLYKPSRDEKTISRSKTQNPDPQNPDTRIPSKPGINQILLTGAVVLVILTDILIFAALLK